MKNSLTYLLTTTLLVYLVTSCQNEIYIDQPLDDSTKQGTQMNYVSDVEVPEIISSITDITGTISIKSLHNSKSIHYKKAKVDLNKILKVKNKDNITNYTFGIEVEGAPLNEFYNLIVNESPKGKVKKPYIIKYEVNEEALDKYIENKGNFKFFRGKKYIMTFESFFDENDINLTKSDHCPPDTGIDIDLTGGGNGPGSDGNFYNMGPENYIQTDASSYNYANEPGAGESYLLYLNAFNPITTVSTSHGDVVRDPVSTVWTNTSPANPFSVTTSLNISMTHIVSTFIIVGGRGPCSATVIHEWNDGTYTIIEHDTCTPFQLSAPITKGTTDCPGEDGEVGVLTKHPKGCSYYDKLDDGIFYFDDGDGNCIPERIIVEPTLENKYPCQALEIKQAFVKSAPLSKLVLDIFDSDTSGYNLVFHENILLGDGDAGGTYPFSVDSQWDLEKLDIEIGLSPYLLNNSTDLALATTVIHESIHAILIYMIRAGKLTVENTRERFDLSLLLDAYLRLQIIEDQFDGVNQDASIVDNYMHEYMTGLVESIASSVSEYGKIKGYNIPFTYYKNLAWLGLRENLESILADDGLDDEELAELNTIQNTILDEFQNRENAKGKKCN